MADNFIGCCIQLFCVGVWWAQLPEEVRFTFYGHYHGASLRFIVVTSVWVLSTVRHT